MVPRCENSNENVSAINLGRALYFNCSNLQKKLGIFWYLWLKRVSVTITANFIK